MPGHPLIWPAAGLLAGIVAANFWPVPAPAVLPAAALALGWALWRASRVGRLPLLWLTLGCLLLGAGLLSWQRAQTLPADHVRWRADNQLRVLLADVVVAPQPTAHGHKVLLSALSLDGSAVSGLVQLSLPPGAGPPAVGHRLELATRLKPITTFANPGGFDYAEYMALQGLWVSAYAGAKAGLKEAPGGEGSLDWWTLMVERARQGLGRLMDGLEPGPARGLLRALVLGQLGELSGPVRDAFAATGTAHLLAISGMNLAIVWGWTFLLLRYGLAAWPGLALRWPVPKLAALAALLPTTAYAFIGGASTPTLRALVMAVCIVLALMVNRTAQSSGALALAVLVIGVIWPEAPLTLSFQLSFVAVAAIIWAAVPLSRRLAGLWSGHRLAAAGLAFLALSAVVEAAVWPLTVLSFHQVPWLSLPANVVMVPLVGTLVQMLALAGCALGLVWPAGGLAVLQLGLWPAKAGIWFISALAGLPWAVSFIQGPGPWVVVLLYAGAAAALALRGAWRWSAGGALTVAALALWVIQAAPPAPDGRLTVWVLDVGQGSSAVARLPDGRVLVADGGGGLGDLDPGQKVLAPFLWAQGLTRTEVLACSHRHPDHAGGLPFLARWFAPREIWTNGQPPEDGPYAGLLEQARLSGAVLRGPAELPREQEMGGARVRVLWPPAGEGAAGLDENNRSLWLGLGLGQTWIWLPGDAGPKVEKAVIPLLPQGGEQLLVAAHHGGKGSCSSELLQHLRPSAVLISCGCLNNFGMPRADTLQRVAEAGARVYSTARQGCLKLVSDGLAWRVTPYLEPPRDCPRP